MVMKLLGLFLIFSARILYVSCNVVRVLFIVRERRLISSCIGFFEVLIYILILEHLLGGGKTLDYLELFVYSGGFAAGNFVGLWLEEHLLNPFVLVQAIMDDDPSTKVVIDKLRAAGVGATVVNGMGLNGPKLVVEAFCRRHEIKSVQKFFAKQSFVAISDIKCCTGGWFSRHTSK